MSTIQNHRRVLAAGITLLLLLLAIVHRANDLDLIADRVSGRVSLYALPVCASAYFHGHRHDYTAYNELGALASHYFYSVGGGTENNPNIAPLVEAMRNTKIMYPQSVFFWGYDNRGLADYCVAAFSLFGPSLAAFSKLWLLILAISAAAFFFAFWERPNGPPILVFFLASAYLGLGFYSFMQVPASLSEERAFEFLSFLPALHLALFPWLGNSQRRSEVALLVAQSALFVFLYHCRGSVGWQILPVLASAATASAFILIRKRRRNGGEVASSGVAKALFPAGALLSGMLALSAYTLFACHPAYFGEQGGRSFYHNALMGLYGLKVDGEAALSISDNVVQQRVKGFVARQRGVTPDQINYFSPFGRTYENDARDYYFFLVTRSPENTLRYYATDKLSTSLMIMRGRTILTTHAFGQVRMGDTMHDATTSEAQQHIREHGLLFAPLAAPISIIVLLFGVAYSRGNIAGLLPALLVGISFFVAGLIPSVAFYNQDMKQLTGAMLAIGFFLHLLAFAVLSSAINLIRKVVPTWPRKPPSETPTTSR